VALAIAMLVILAFLASLLIQRSSIVLPSFRSLVAQPEAWLVLALLWLLPVTFMNMQPTSTQNLTVYVVVIVILLLSRLGTQLVSHALKPLALFSSGALILAGIMGLRNPGIWDDWAILAIGSNPRLFATYGILAICLMFAISIENKLRFPIIALLYASIVISESRTALAAALIVIVLGVVFVSRKPLLTAVGA